MKIKAFVFEAALPGANTYKGVRTYELTLDMACRDGRHYFITNDSSARSPNRFFIEMGLGTTWLIG